MPKLYIGIDPGIANGAIAIIDENKTILYNANLPLVKNKNKKVKPILDLSELKEILLDKGVDNCYYELDPLRSSNIMVVIEQVHALNMPGQKQGISSSGRFMKACGQLEGLCIGMGASPILVSPQAWKKHFGLIKKEKEDSVKLAEEIFDVKFRYKYQHNQAESLLIAYYGMEVMSGR